MCVFKMLTRTDKTNDNKADFIVLKSQKLINELFKDLKSVRQSNMRKILYWTLVDFHFTFLQNCSESRITDKIKDYPC